MRKHTLASRNLGTYTSPGTPDYQDNGIGGGGEIPRGCCSERVPLPTNGGGRHTSLSALMPLSSGRTLPSKWDDAERWITSPVSGFTGGKVLPAQTHRRPKSKSGPLGEQGKEGFSSYSPALPVGQNGIVRDFMVGAPFTTGVLVADGLSIHYSGRHGTGVYCNPLHSTNNVARTASCHPGWSDLLSEASLPSSQDEKIDGGAKNDQTLVSRVVSRRDMATQMSPSSSTHSSPKGRLSSFTSPPTILSIDMPHHCDPSPKLEIRDVQVDKRANVTKQSKKIISRKTNRDPTSDFTSSWEIAETEKQLSRLQREELKITAWENLQKAKAEAAIRKLEMKLEKKRSATMDKILNKLRNAQMEAEEMRSCASGGYTTESPPRRTSPPPPAPPASSKKSLFRKHVKVSGLGGCFACHAL